MTMGRLKIRLPCNMHSYYSQQFSNSILTQFYCKGITTLLNSLSKYPHWRSAEICHTINCVTRIRIILKPFTTQFNILTTLNQTTTENIVGKSKSRQTALSFFLTIGAIPYTSPATAVTLTLYQTTKF